MTDVNPYIKPGARVECINPPPWEFLMLGVRFDVDMVDEGMVRLKGLPDYLYRAARFKPIVRVKAVSVRY